MIIAVGSEKGGTGKTMTVLALAQAFAETGRKALVVDLDPTAQISRLLLGQEGKKPNITGIWTCDPDFQLQKSIFPTRIDGVSCLPGDINAIPFPVGSVDDPADSRLLLFRQVLQSLGKSSSPFDAIFLDTPPSRGGFTLSAFLAANIVLVPVPATYWGVPYLIRETVRLVGCCQPRNADLRHVGFFLTQFDVAREKRNQVAADSLLLEAPPGSVLETVIPFSQTLMRAWAFIETPVPGMPTSSGWDAYKTLAEEILRRESTTPPKR